MRVQDTEPKAARQSPGGTHRCTQTLTLPAAVPASQRQPSLKPAKGTWGGRSRSSRFGLQPVELCAEWEGLQGKAPGLASSSHTASRTSWVTPDFLYQGATSPVPELEPKLSIFQHTCIHTELGRRRKYYHQHNFYLLVIFTHASVSN